MCRAEAVGGFCFAVAMRSDAEIRAHNVNLVRIQRTKRKRRAANGENQEPQRLVEFRGAARDLQTCDAHEVIISGPADTGKTFAALYKLNRLAETTSGLQAVMMRKHLADVFGTCLQTYVEKVLGTTLSALSDGTHPTIRSYGGQKPEWFDYLKTGARVWVGGIDHPGKALSGERDVVYFNQAEEAMLEDWETLVSRASGRAGHTDKPQIIGDCNPGPETHWIKSRETVRLLESKHEDNPSLYTADGQITPSGVQRMAALDSLTGLRYQRLRKGLWVSAEGVIYEFTGANLIDPFAIPPEWKRYRAIDFGYTNPFVCGWWAEDPDGRLYLYRQIYMTGRIVSDHAAQIIELSKGEKILATVCDHDAEDMATLRKCGIPTTPAVKMVKTGIEAVQDRLRVKGDGRPRLFVVKGSLVEVDRELQQNRRPISTEQEFATYTWKGSKVKDEPRKEDDHGMDMTRYMVMYRERRGILFG